MILRSRWYFPNMAYMYAYEEVPRPHPTFCNTLLGHYLIFPGYNLMVVQVFCASKEKETKRCVNLVIEKISVITGLEELINKSEIKMQKRTRKICSLH